MLVNDGVGFTSIVKLTGAPKQPFNNGVTVINASSGIAEPFATVNDGISPDPLDGRPMLGIVLVQLYVVEGKEPEKKIVPDVSPLQIVWLRTVSAVGVGLITT